MNMAQLSRKVVLGIAVIALLLASACGDDDDDTSGDADGSDASIRIMTWQTLENPSYSAPQVKTAAEAAVKGINDRGGINGRLIELEFCDVNFDPNAEAACARRAVDGNFVAVVGSTTLYPNTLPLLARAGIAHIGGPGITPAELTSEISFPLSGSNPGWFQGAAAEALEQGVRRPAIVVSPAAAAQFGADQFEAALETAGIEAVRTVSVPIGAPDQSAAAAQAADDTDAVFVATLPSDAVKIVQSLRQSGYRGVIAGTTATFAESLASLGDAGNGLQLSSQVTPVTKTDDPGIARFSNEMDAVDSTATKDERAQLTWGSYQMLAEVLQDVEGDVTAKSVLDAMNTLDQEVDTEVTDPYSVAGKTSPLPDYPRIFSPTVVFTEVQNHQIVQTSDGFVDPYAVLKRIAGG